MTEFDNKAECTGFRECIVELLYEKTLERPSHNKIRNKASLL